MNAASIAFAGGLSFLIDLLHTGNEVQKASAVLTLEKLAAEDKYRIAIASAGGIETLVYLLRTGNDIQKVSAVDALRALVANYQNNDLKEKASRVLAELAFGEVGTTKILVSGGTPPLIEFIRTEIITRKN